MLIGMLIGLLIRLLGVPNDYLIEMLILCTEESFELARRDALMQLVTSQFIGFKRQAPPCDQIDEK